MASSNGPQPVSMETYWKRRVFVLAGILVVVALVAYACSGPPDEGRRAANADKPGADDGFSASPTPSPPVSPSPSASPSPSGDPSASPSASGSAGPGGAADSGGSDDDGGGGGAAAPKKASDPCRPQDVVVNLKVNRSDFAWDAKPKFTVTATNTGDQECTVDLGAKNMEVRVTSGEDKVYSTAHCAKGGGAKKERLVKGVGETKTVEWNRKRNWSDCRKADVTANRPGTYVVTVIGDFNDDHGEHKQVFRLN